MAETAARFESHPALIFSIRQPDIGDTVMLYLKSLLRKACSAEFLPEAAGRARVSGRDAAFAG